MAPKTMSATCNSFTRRDKSQPPPTCCSAAGRRLAYAQKRPGLTLMEIMLVLAVLVAVAAIALPALHGPMSDQRLRKAGDLVLAQWARARLTAMKTGQMQVFVYEIGSEFYRVQPFSNQTDALEASADADQTLAPNAIYQDPSQAQRDSVLGVAGQRLPSGVTFFLGEIDVDTRLAQAQSEGATAELGGALAQPIVFYPDGTTTSARLVLTNERFFVELKLRGLTGMGRASDLLITEEIAP